MKTAKDLIKASVAYPGGNGSSLTIDLADGDEVGDLISEIPTYVRDYVATALWSSSDESDENGGEPFDVNYDIDDVSDASIIQCIADCDAFIARAGAMIHERGVEQAMHDFWLTRNGHGAGFWDGDWPENGDALTKLAKSFGEVNVLLGDDGLIYFC